jgi:hypothetical protein
LDNKTIGVLKKHAKNDEISILIKAKYMTSNQINETITTLNPWFKCNHKTSLIGVTLAKDSPENQ